MNKKAQGISMNFLVIMAISVIVMVIIIGIFLVRSRAGSQEMGSCAARGGVCVTGTCFNPTSGANADDVTGIRLSAKCENIGSQPAVCCLMNFRDKDAQPNPGQ